MMTLAGKLPSAAVGLALALVAPHTFAQDPTSPIEGTLPPPKVAPRVEAQVAVAPAKARVEQDDAVSDHEKVVGHLGVGYLGVSDLPISGGGGPVPGRASVSAPIIGVRYWLSEKLGLDLGLGLGVVSGSNEVATANSTTQTDLGTRFGVAIHGGVPLVLAHQKHFKFLAIPELNVGFTNQSNEVPNGAAVTKTTLSGFRLDIGARVGAEIHFGFIGVPQLALQGTVGVFVKREAWKTTAETAGATTSASQSATAFGTSVQSDPWALFTNNISAIYYLP